MLGASDKSKTYKLYDLVIKKINVSRENPPMTYISQKLKLNLHYAIIQVIFARGSRITFRGPNEIFFKPD